MCRVKSTIFTNFFSLKKKTMFTDQSPPVTYSHELSVVTERMRLRFIASKMSFCRVTVLSSRDKVRSSAIQEATWSKVAAPSHWREVVSGFWSGHPPGCFLSEVFEACPTGWRIQGRFRTCWRDHIYWLAWEWLYFPGRAGGGGLGEGALWQAAVNQTLIRGNLWMDGKI